MKIHIRFIKKIVIINYKEYLENSDKLFNWKHQLYCKRVTCINKLNYKKNQEKYKTPINKIKKNSHKNLMKKQQNKNSNK